MKKIFTLFAIFACLPILLSAKGPAVIGGSTYTADNFTVKILRNTRISYCNLISCQCTKECL